MTLSHRDARDLDRYFKLGQFERSIMGGILDKAEMFSTIGQRKGGAVTVNITAEHREQPRVEPDSEKLEVIGRVSRKLNRLSPLHHAALAAFHGDHGARCAAQLKKHGRIAALFGLVPAGAKLVKVGKKSAGPTKLNLTAAQLIANVVSIQEVQPMANRAPLLELATRQALELKEAAESAYTEAGR